MYNSTEPDCCMYVIYSQYLWILVVEESDLTNELRIMKDYFLLGRGELFLAFIDQASHLLRTPVSSTTEHGMDVESLVIHCFPVL